MDRMGPALAVIVVALGVAAAVTTAAMDGEQFAYVGLPFVFVGAYLMARGRGGHIGWVLAAIGVLVTTGATCATVASAFVAGGGQPTAVVTAIAWYAEWYWVPFLYLLLAGLPLLLPTGQLRSRYARRIWALMIGLGAVMTATAMFQRDLLADDAPMAIVNPVGWLPYDDVDHSWMSMVIAFGAVVLGVASAVAVVRRLRRSSGIERQQLKIVTAGVIASGSGFVINMVLRTAFGIGVPPWAISALVGVIPLTILLAVLRYRLFDIDRLVSRTVTYAVVSAVLVVVYAAVVVVPAVLFNLQSDFLVAVATLAAAAAFIPVRHRVQQFVDRRFNRARYDAARVSEQFADRLRHHLVIDALADDLHRAVVVTLQPAHMSLWLPTDRR